MILLLEYIKSLFDKTTQYYILNILLLKNIKRGLIKK